MCLLSKISLPLDQHILLLRWDLRVKPGRIHAGLDAWVNSGAGLLQPLCMTFEEPHEREFLLKKETQ